MTVEVKYEGELAIGMIFTCPDSDGELGFRRVKVIGRHPDTGDWLIEELPSRLMTKVRGDIGAIRRCPEINLRIVFVPEET